MKGERKTEQNKIKEQNTKLYKNAKRGKREREKHPGWDTRKRESGR